MSIEAAGRTDARRGRRLDPRLLALVLLPACARAIISTRPDTVPGRLAPALVQAWAVVGSHRLVAQSVDDPSKERTLCSAPVYEVREDASFIELVPGSYEIHADLLPTAGPSFSRWGVPVRGLVTVQAGQCYSMALVCESETGLDWEQTCRVVLRPGSCSQS